jgi:hypothetical protein
MKAFAKLLIIVAVFGFVVACAPQAPAPPAVTVAPTVDAAQDA